MKKLMNVAMLAAVAGLGASASADIRLNNELSIPSFNTRVDRGTVGYATGFEAVEGFAQGNVAGQNAWSDNAPRQAMQIVNGVNAGNGSANALRMSVGPQAQGAFGQAFTPVLSQEHKKVSVDVKIDDNAGANYGLAGIKSAGGPLTFQVDFDYLGNIFLRGTALGSVDTGIAWLHNAWQTLTLEFVSGGVTLTYGSSTFNGPLNAGGTVNFDVVTFYHDNYQAFGSGSFSGGTTAGYFDNLSISKPVPAPAMAGVLGLGGLLAARRRRA